MERENQPTEIQEPGPIEKQGRLETIFKLFYQPSEAFKSFSSRIDWLLPLIIIAVIGGIGYYLTQPVTVRDMEKKTLENLEKYRDQLPQERYNEIISDVQKRFDDAKENRFQWYLPIVLLVVPFIFMLIIAVIGYTSGNFVFGGRASFWMVVNVIAYAALIGLLGDIVREAMMMAKNTMYVYTGLGLLKPIDDGSFIYYLFRQVDVFSIWRIAVTCIGLGVIYKMKPGKFAFVLFPVWIVFIVLVALGNATIFMGNLMY